MAILELLTESLKKFDIQNQDLKILMGSFMHWSVYMIRTIMETFFSDLVKMCPKLIMLILL